MTATKLKAAIYTGLTCNLDISFGSILQLNQSK
jgi:hypothetical protein